MKWYILSLIIRLEDKGNNMILLQEHIDKFCDIHNLSDIKRNIYSLVFFGEKTMETVHKCWSLCEQLNKSFDNNTGENLTADSIPVHYTKNASMNIPNEYKEPIHFIEFFHLGFSGGNILKYLFRCEDKGKKFDVDKVMFYCCYYIVGTYAPYKQYLGK